VKPTDALATNVRFWHMYPGLVCDGLTEVQVHWQPDNHPNHIAFTLWHALTANDQILSRIVMGRPTVFETGGWAGRLPASQDFAGDLDRERLAQFKLDTPSLLAYSDAVRDELLGYIEDLSEEDAVEQLDFSFFETVYPGYGSMSRLDAIIFFAVGHLGEHLGEVQYIKGLMGMRGAPL